jgi:hypothetical protein
MDQGTAGRGSRVHYDYPHETPRAERPVRTPRYPVFGLLGALLCVFAYRSLNRSQDSLLIGASRVRNADDIRIVGWMSERELLALSPRYPSREAILIDIESGRRTRMEGLTAALFSNERDEPLYRPRLVLSPDRQWLLYLASGGHGPQAGPRIDAVDLDGKSRLSWKLDSRPDERAASLVWSADSTRWYRFRRVGDERSAAALQIFEHRLDNPKAVTTRRIAADDFRPRGTVNGMLLSSDYFWGDEPPLDRPAAFRTLDLASAAPRPARVPLSLPTSTRGYMLIPAASADRIVVDSWTSDSDVQPRWGKWLGTGEGDPSQLRHTVQLFDTRGKRLYEVGKLRTRLREHMGDSLRFMSCSPSGRRVMFRLNDTVYVKELADAGPGKDP